MCFVSYTHELRPLQVSVGVAEDEGEDSGSEWAEEVLAQAQEAAEAAKENLHTSRPGSRVCFLSRDQEGRTSLSILNPDSLEGECWGGAGEGGVSWLALAGSLWCLYFEPTYMYAIDFFVTKELAQCQVNLDNGY